MDGLNALEKLNLTFRTTANYKVANKALFKTLMQVLYRDDNAILLRKMLRTGTSLIAPVVSEIIQQGTREGVFDTPFPEQAGELIFGIGRGTNETVAALFLELPQKPQNKLLIEKQMDMYENAIERILGAPSGSIHIADRDLILSFAS